MSSSEPQDQPPDNEDPAPSSDPLEQQQNADTSRDANNNGDPNGLSTTSNNLSDDPSPPSSSSSPPLILYRPPTIWGLLRGAAINLILPFVNGLMMGFGELLAHEAAFRLGWSGTRVFPTHRTASRSMGPGVEVQEDPVERRRRDGEEMDQCTSLE